MNSISVLQIILMWALIWATNWWPKKSWADDLKYENGYYTTGYAWQFKIGPVFLLMLFVLVSVNEVLNPPETRDELYRGALFLSIFLIFIVVFALTADKYKLEFNDIGFRVYGWRHYREAKWQELESASTSAIAPSLVFFANGKKVDVPMQTKGLATFCEFIVENIEQEKILIPLREFLRDQVKLDRALD